MRPTLVKDHENMVMLADELRKSGHTCIDTGNGAVDVYKDGKIVKKIKVQLGYGHFEGVLRLPRSASAKEDEGQ